ncbi:PREDICTED: uncharacterized protein LOC104606435 [Nelumbo nucifera]|uniref:Uncharacterized protein LOC104606435 n=1 Tax=Nelumbo nucifera TaxID=4432 RepID=A0A1U8ATZ6_NELNU|nr:PREDICTED: uncharacterized protein LOC104606435 [Nelumbo nucifera]
MGKIKKKNQKEGNENDRGYLNWNIEMDRALAAVLIQLLNSGNKTDGGWKPIAYSTATEAMRMQFPHISITKDNIKNRLKVWKIHYAFITDMLRQSGFTWDYTRNTISFTDENVWKTYVEANPGAIKYRNKVIENWDDIVTICGSEKANGEGAETAADAEEANGDDAGDTNSVSLEGTRVVDALNSPNGVGIRQAKVRLSSTLVNPLPSKKSKTKDTLASAIAKMAASLEKYMLASSKKESDPREVYEEVCKVPELEEMECLKACQCFMDDVKAFSMLKSLPIERRKGWVLLTISRHFT